MSATLQDILAALERGKRDQQRSQPRGRSTSLEDIRSILRAGRDGSSSEQAALPAMPKVDLAQGKRRLPGRGWTYEAAVSDPANAHVVERVRGAARKVGLPEDIALRQVWQESRFRATARSPKGAGGYFQFMPATAARFGLQDPTDLEQSAQAYEKYMDFLLKRFGGRVDLALAGYNAGEGAVDKFKGIPPYSETQNYVRSIMGGGLSAANSAPITSAMRPSGTDLDSIRAVLRGGMEPAAPSAAPAGKTLLIGDSMAEGVYPYLKRSREVVPAFKRGRTIQQQLQALDRTLAQNPDAHEVVISLGTNDYESNPQETARLVQQMRAKLAGKKVRWLTPVDDNPTTRAIRENFPDSFDSSAATLGLRGKYGLPNNVHLNGQGYAAWAQAAFGATPQQGATRKGIFDFNVPVSTPQKPRVVKGGGKGAGRPDPLRELASQMAVAAGGPWAVVEQQSGIPFRAQRALGERREVVRKQVARDRAIQMAGPHQEAIQGYEDYYLNQAPPEIREELEQETTDRLAEIARQEADHRAFLASLTPEEQRAIETAGARYREAGGWRRFAEGASLGSAGAIEKASAATGILNSIASYIGLKPFGDSPEALHRNAMLMQEVVRRSEEENARPGGETLLDRLNRAAGTFSIAGPELLFGSRILRGATLPVYGALSGYNQGPFATLKGAAEGYAMHRLMGRTAPLGSLRNVGIWTAVPTLHGMAQGQPWDEALANALPFALLAGSGARRIRLYDTKTGEVRPYRISDPGLTSRSGLERLRSQGLEVVQEFRFRDQYSADTWTDRFKDSIEVVGSKARSRGRVTLYGRPLMPSIAEPGALDVPASVTPEETLGKDPTSRAMEAVQDIYSTTGRSGGFSSSAPSSNSPRTIRTVTTPDGHQVKIIEDVNGQYRAFDKTVKELRHGPFGTIEEVEQALAQESQLDIPPMPRRPVEPAPLIVDEPAVDPAPRVLPQAGERYQRRGSDKVHEVLDVRHGMVIHRGPRGGHSADSIDTFLRGYERIADVTGSEPPQGGPIEQASEPPTPEASPRGGLQHFQTWRSDDEYFDLGRYQEHSLYRTPEGEIIRDPEAKVAQYEEPGWTEDMPKARYDKQADTVYINRASAELLGMGDDVTGLQRDYTHDVFAELESLIVEASQNEWHPELEAYSELYAALDEMAEAHTIGDNRRFRVAVIEAETTAFDVADTNAHEGIHHADPKLDPLWTNYYGESEPETEAALRELKGAALEGLKNSEEWQLLFELHLGNVAEEQTPFEAFGVNGEDHAGLASEILAYGYTGAFPPEEMAIWRPIIKRVRQAMKEAHGPDAMQEIMNYATREFRPAEAGAENDAETNQTTAINRGAEAPGSPALSLRDEDRTGAGGRSSRPSGAANNAEPVRRPAAGPALRPSDSEYGSGAGQLESSQSSLQARREFLIDSILEESRDLFPDEGQKFLSGPEPELRSLVASALDFGRSIYHSGLRFKDFASQLVRKFGSSVRPFAERVWANIREVASDESRDYLGVRKFHQEILEPTARAAVKGSHETIVKLVQLFAPRFGVNSRAVDTIMTLKGLREEAKTKLSMALRAERQRLAQWTRAETLDFIDRVKRGERQATPENQSLADTMRTVDDAAFISYNEETLLDHALQTSSNKVWKLYQNVPQAERVNFFRYALEYDAKSNPHPQTTLPEPYQKIARRIPEAVKAQMLAFKEDHYRVLWKVVPGGGSKSPHLQSMVSSRPLAGSQGFKRQSTLESFSEGVTKGGEPMSWNPVTMFEIAQSDLMRAVTARRMWRGLRELGFAKFVPNQPRKNKAGEITLSNEIPEGFTDIDDRSAKVFFHTPAGVVSGGRWMVRADAARLINNYLSPDLIRRTALGRGAVAAKNHITALELSLSGFHAVFEGMDTISSAMGLGTREMILGLTHGDSKMFLRGAKDWALSPLAPFPSGKEIGINWPPKFSTPVGEAWQGRRYGFTIPKVPGSYHWLGDTAFKYFQDPQRFLGSPEGRQLLKEYPEYEQTLHDAFVGGFKLELAEDYKVHALESFKQSLAELKADPKYSDKITPVLRSPWALNQRLMRPLFEEFIPRLKWGLFVREYSVGLREHAREIETGRMTREELSRNVVDFVEDRLGEANFDNFFWKRTFRTGLQLAFRSVTWRAGSLRALLGTPLEQSRYLGRYMSAPRGERAGRVPIFSPKMAWFLNLTLLTAAMGTIIHKLFTGKDPETMPDVLAPQIDPDDEHARVSIPTYWKDLTHLWHSMNESSFGLPTSYVASGLSGPISRLYEIANNKDFYGTKVYEEDDNFLGQKGLDMATHLIPSPFSVRGFQRLRERGESLPKAALFSFGGIPQAPAYLSETPAQREMYRMLQEKLPAGSRTTEEAERSRARGEITQKLRKGKREEAIDEIVAQLRQGSLSSEQATRILQAGQVSKLESDFKRLTLPEAVKIWDLMSEEEKSQSKAAMQTKIINNLPHLAPEEREVLMPSLQRIQQEVMSFRSAPQIQPMPQRPPGL